MFVMPGLIRGCHLTDSKKTIQATANPVKGRSLWADGIRRLRKRTFAMICLGVVLVYFVLAGMIFLNDVFDWNLKVFQWNQIVGPSYQGPLDSYEWTPEGQTEVRTGKALFGTDFMGQSTLRKTVYGAKTSITVALCASFISLLIGVPLGAIAGYFRGWVDDVIVWFYTTLGTIPYILLVMAFAVVLRDRNIFGWEIRGITAVYLAIGLTSWVGICRLIRGEKS